MNLEILEENVYYYRDVIKDPQKLLEAIEGAPLEVSGIAIPKWDEWKACSGEHYVYGTEMIIYPPDSQEVKTANNDYIFNTVNDAMQSVARDYAIAHNDFSDPKLFPMFPIKKYQAGTYMGTHFDQQEGDDRLKYSLVMYLNDDYIGGELSFTIRSPEGPIYNGGPRADFEKAQEDPVYTFAIKPEAGSMIIFPPSPPYHHASHLIKSGSKYMVPQHWVH